MSTNQEKASWLAGLLSGWGIKESWAKVIAGAIIGAAVAAGLLSVSSCHPSYNLGEKDMLFDIQSVEQERSK